MNQEMEQGLKEALRRKPAPEGFARRVMARLPEQAAAAREMPRTMRPRRAWLAVPLAAGLALAAFGGVRYQQYRQGQEAKRQLLLALRITGEMLTLAQNQVAGLNDTAGVGERRGDQ